ncbi:hybrid sensor histidine kinase/response regulator [Gracilimonas sp. Q87]|uniref:ATP-binding response regulator n=1 Tax=Gracilimonas sp. Q87 TaxID=3384766 RepID=UPI0039845E28
MKNNIHLSEMVETLSHELRTPLNAILGYSELLSKSENLTDDQKSHISSIANGGQQLLHIINDIIELSNIETGKVELQSEVNKGSTVAVSIPIKHSAMSLVKQENEFAEIDNATYSPKALIVDDLVMNRTLARIMLETRNFITLEAENGKEAVQIFNDDEPDIILMDISMPIMNGVDAMHQIRELDHTEYSNTPIIAITAGGHAGSRSELMEKGFSEYIQKPYREEELIRKISMFIQVPEQDLKAVAKI